VLNIAERAVAQLRMDNDEVRFSARFGGVSHAVIVPIDAVLAIYARENGQGMELPPDIVAQDSASPAQSVESMPESDDAPPDDEPPGSEPPPKRGGHLRIVK
jgi:stringent starvation protein B